jgi:c-di-GMP-binding flagellar brake protein YcgR
MKNNSEPEQRGSPRWIKNLIAAYSTLQGERVTDTALTVNISSGGMQLLLTHQLKEGELVEIKIELAQDSIPILATGKVVYAAFEGKLFKTGLEFVQIEDFQRARLLRYLKEK